MLFLASGLVGDDTETTSEGVLWGAMPLYYYYTFYVIGKNLRWFCVRQEFRSGWD